MLPLFLRAQVSFWDYSDTVVWAIVVLGVLASTLSLLDARSLAKRMQEDRSAEVLSSPRFWSSCSGGAVAAVCLLTSARDLPQGPAQMRLHHIGVPVENGRTTAQRWREDFAGL